MVKNNHPFYKTTEWRIYSIRSWFRNPTKYSLPFVLPPSSGAPSKQAFRRQTTSPYITFPEICQKCHRGLHRIEKYHRSRSWCWPDNHNRRQTIVRLISLQFVLLLNHHFTISRPWPRPYSLVWDVRSGSCRGTGSALQAADKAK